MIPLIILLMTFFGLEAYRLFTRRSGAHKRRNGRIAMALMLVFTGVCHFIFVEPLLAMIPPFLPAPLSIVYATGVLEMVGAVALLFEATHRQAAGLLFLFLLLVLPANIYGAYIRVELGGHTMGLVYLWFRVPLQLFFCAWLLWSSGLSPLFQRVEK